MVKLTNKLRLPEPIVRAVSNDVYTKSGADFSVTEILSPAHMVRLRNEYWDLIEEDVADRIPSLRGQAMHAIIERASTGDDVLSEVTIITEFEGIKLKGTVDHVTISKSELCDYKETTVWKVKGGKLPQEWVQQTNVYRWMLHREKNLTINSMAIIAILRDWQKREAARDQDYPQTPALRLEIPIWPLEVTEAFVRSRLDVHQMQEPPGCSDEEIWAKPSKWAVMQRGRKTAVRLLDSNEEAEAYIARERIVGASVQYRPGVATRCESYCAVSKWCQQWANDPRNTSKADSDNVVKGMFSEV